MMERTDFILDLLALTYGYRPGMSWVAVAAYGKQGRKDSRSDANYGAACSRAAAAGWERHS